MSRGRTRREVLLFQNLTIPVQRRAYKRSIGLTLQASGRIRVSAPYSTPISRIELFLFANKEWIETQLEKYSALRAANPMKRYMEGESFPLIGVPRRLIYGIGHRSFAEVALLEDELIVKVPKANWENFQPHRPHPELTKVIANFYSGFARTVLDDRLRFFSDQMGVRPSAVSFRSQKTRWGSCSSRGRISLNWRLIIAPMNVIDYVVVHELAHLRHYNHSSEFWKLVATFIPDHPQRRKWLNEHQYDADFLAKKSELHSFMD